MSSSLKRIIILVSVGLLLFMASGSFFMRHALACELLPVFGYSQIQGEAYAAPGFGPERFGGFQELLSAASDRIADVYGPAESRPRLVVTDDVNTARRWGANETASMHRLPWRSCIVIGPQGQNVDVLAHEGLHAEIQHRVGFWRFLRQVPVWFDEGAALTLDYRDPFLPENINLSAEQVAAVRELARAREFFNGNVRQNYQAARMSVVPLIHADTFFADLDRIAAGERFEAVFAGEMR
jgi:hypothetical protein